MKKEFEKPEAVIVVFSLEDVIATSATGPQDSGTDDTGFEVDD